MVEIRFYSNDAEIERDDENWTFIHVGYGSKSIAAKGWDSFVPNSVADGNDSMETYIRNSVNSTRRKGRVPVLIFPFKTEQDGVALYEKKNLFVSTEYRLALFGISIGLVDVIYVQCLGKFFRVASSDEIGSYQGSVRHDSGGFIIQVGTGEFYSGYLKDMGFYRTDQDNPVLSHRPVTFPNLEKMESIILSKIGSVQDSKWHEFFIVVFQYAGSSGEPGTFDIPDDVVAARILMFLNDFSIKNKMMFEAAFTTSLLVDAKTQEKMRDYAERYREKIKNVFERSVAIRDSSKEVTDKESRSWRTLELAFPKNEYNRVDLTFVDAEETSKIGKKRSRPIAELMSPRKLKPVPELNRPEVVNAVNLLNNKRRDRTQKATVRAETAIKKFSRSLVAHEKSRVDSAEKAVEKIVGRYPLDEEHDFMITDDPVSIFAKSTGQDWEEESCEKDGGSHNEGVYSDIEIGNCVVFIVEKEADHPVARLMLRWCDDEKGNVGFGIEGRWYYTTKPGYGTKAAMTDKTLLYPRMPAVKATALVAKILQEKGLYDYSTCTTPYYYGGYSDISRASKVRISYGNLLKTNKALLERYLKADSFNISTSPMSEILAFFREDPVEIDYLKEADLNALYDRLVSDKDVESVAGIIEMLFKNFGAKKSVEKARPLLSLSFRPGSALFFTVLENLLNFLEKILYSKRDSDWDGIIEMLYDADLSSINRVVVKILAFIGLVGPDSVCAKVPKSYAESYNDSPMVLMALLLVYSHGRNDEGFDYCVRQLASLYNLKNLTAKLRARSEKIAAEGSAHCYDGKRHLLNQKYFCERDCTDELFITRRWDESKAFTIGISVIVEWNNDYIPTGYFGPGSARKRWDGDIEERIQTAVDRLGFKIDALSKATGENLAARYPAE